MWGELPLHAAHVLAGQRQFPLRAVPFLDGMVQRGLLRRVGGGWVFVHRLLREHLAEG